MKNFSSKFAFANFKLGGRYRLWLCCLTALISPKMFENYKQDNTSINPVINPVIKYCWVDNTYMFLGTDILFENLYKKF